MSDAIPIIADVPSEDPRLGFGDYADAIAAAIRGGEPARFTIGIYGPWGSGKSSLLNAIMRRLEADETAERRHKRKDERDGEVIPVLFDAWRYERQAHIVLPLLHRIRTVLAGRDRSLGDRFDEVLKSLSIKLKFEIPGFAAVEFGRDGGRDAAGASAGGSTGAFPDVGLLDDAYSRPFMEMSGIASALGRRRIAVLVDDLDRCSPDSVVEVLEAINLVMDQPGFVFVLALDYDVLVRAVNEKYPHASGHAFIEKMIQVPFQVPKLDIAEGSFLDDLIPHWKRHSKEFPGDVQEYAYDVATLGLDSNPRRIKRFVNTLLLLLRVTRSRELDVRPELIAAIVGLQLRWPQEYRQFAEAVDEAVKEGDQAPTNLWNALDSTSQVLKAYFERFFQSVPSTRDLQKVIRLAETLTSTPTIEPATDEPGEAADSHLPRPAEEDDRQEAEDLQLVEPAGRAATSRGAFIAAAKELGFYQEAGRPECLRHPLDKNKQFTAGKRRVTYQERPDESAPWVPDRKFLLPRELGEALEFMRRTAGTDPHAPA